MHTFALNGSADYSKTFQFNPDNDVNIVYDFTQDGLQPSVTEICLCDGIGLSFDLQEPVICCALTATLGTAQIEAFNSTEIIYRTDITITNVGGSCTESTLQLTSAYSRTINLGVGTHSILFTLPISGGTIDLLFTNLCNGQSVSAGIGVPAVPCCPFSLTFGTPTQVGTSASGAIFDIPIRFAYTTTVGCAIRPATVTSTLTAPFTVSADRTVRVTAPLTGGTFTFTASDGCGFTQNFDVTFPAAQCCTGVLSLSSQQSTQIGSDYELTYVFLLTETTGCVPSNYTLSSAEFPSQTIVAGVPTTVVFTVPTSRGGEIMTFIATGDCNNQPIRLTSVVPELDCCLGNVVFNSVTRLSDTELEVCFVYNENPLNCISASIAGLEYEIGTDTIPAQFGNSLVAGQEYCRTLIVTGAAGNVVVNINNGCDNNTYTYTTPYPPNPPCCTYTVTFGDIIDQGVVGGIRDIGIPVTITEGVGCTPSDFYEILIDGNLVLFDPAGNYEIGYQIPETGSQNLNIQVRSICSGEIKRVTLTYSKPPCCNYSFRFRDGLRTVFRGPTFTTYEITPEILFSGPVGCTQPSDPEISSAWFSRRDIDGTTFQFDVPNFPIEPDFDFTLFVCDELGDERSLPFPTTCCQFTTNVTSLVRTSQSGISSTYSFSITFTPQTFGVCDNTFIRLDIANVTSFIPVELPYNSTTFTYNGTFTALDVITFFQFRINSTTGGVNYICFPEEIQQVNAPSAQCCSVNTSNLTIVPTGAVNTQGLPEWAVTFNLDIVDVGGCTSPSPIRLDINGGASIPLSEGNNTFRFFGDVASDFGGVIRGTCGGDLFPLNWSTPAGFTRCCVFTNFNQVGGDYIGTLTAPNTYTFFSQNQSIPNTPFSPCNSYGFEVVPLTPAIISITPSFFSDNVGTVFTVVINPLLIVPLPLPSESVFLPIQIRNRCGTFTLNQRVRVNTCCIPDLRLTLGTPHPQPRITESYLGNARLIYQYYPSDPGNPDPDERNFGLNLLEALSPCVSWGTYDIINNVPNETPTDFITTALTGLVPSTTYTISVKLPQNSTSSFIVRPTNGCGDFIVRLFRDA